MPYKNHDEQKTAQAKHYQNNKRDYYKRFQKRRVERRKWFLKLKASLRCEKCGENHSACLDFHHRNPNEKTLGLAKMVNRAMSPKTILAEISKCDVLCANCHRKLHWDEERLSEDE